MKISWLFMALFSWMDLFPLPATGMENKTIIDMHCHIAGIGAGGSGCFVSERLLGSWRYRVYLQAFGVTENELRQHGDEVILQRLAEELAKSRYVAQAVILALDGVIGPDGELDRANTEVFIPNEYVAAGIRRHQNLRFGASINPYRHDALARLDKAAADGAVLVKWLPSIQRIDPSDPRLIPFYGRLTSLGLPLLTHTGTEHSFSIARDELGDPELLRLPLSLGVTVIAAHSACNGRNHGTANYDRLLRLCREYPNLYADISALTQINRLGCLVRALRQPDLAGRLVYGTDMPLLRTRLVTPFAFPFQLSFRQMLAISRIENCWDRDVALKQALGVGDEVLVKAVHLLRAEQVDSI